MDDELAENRPTGGLLNRISVSDTYSGGDLTREMLEERIESLAKGSFGYNTEPVYIVSPRMKAALSNTARVLGVTERAVWNALQGYAWVGEKGVTSATEPILTEFTKQYGHTK